VPSGFGAMHQTDVDRLATPIPVSRPHVRFAGTRCPAVVPSPVPSANNAVTVYVARSQSPADVPMALGGGRNTDATGLGDSQHAVPDSSPPEQGTSVSAPLVGLPPTASSATVDMLDALHEIQSEHVSPLSSSSESSECGGGPCRHLVFEEGHRYASLEQAGGDIRALGEGHNELISTVE